MSKPKIHTAKGLEEPICVDYDEAYTALKDGDVLDEHGLMSWGSNYTFLVTVKHNDKSFLAAYKPRMGERPLWDFPDGTLCQRETAAFVLSEMLAWYIVPPTILRQASRGIGSVQIFIDHDPNRHYFTLDESHIPQLQRIAAFDALANNADRKGGHCLLDADDRIWSIDHGLTFHPSSKLRTVIWDFAGQRIPADILTDMKNLCTVLEDNSNPLRNQLFDLLRQNEFVAMQLRLDKLVNMGKYPLPGPGPNRPWPAV
ncbi:MAG: SCO1664 family protein [Anaerolineae bacterium]|nr:SCO1664 family protein [Anaerolineae bacterium]